MLYVENLVINVFPGIMIEFVIIQLIFLINHLLCFMHVFKFDFNQF